MHMKVIYGTSIKDNAKEIIKELKQGKKLADILNIYDDVLEQFIPEADCITTYAFGDEDEDYQESVPENNWGKISVADRKDLFNLVSEYWKRMSDSSAKVTAIPQTYSCKLISNL